jgi:aspartate aminotransferase-like enzyme
MVEPLLMIPGPTNLSKTVRDVMARPQIGHVTPSFREQFKELLLLARYVFRNEKGVQYVFSGSGTLGMESSVVSVVSHGDRTLVLDNGYFGKRLEMLNEVHGARVDTIAYSEGEHADPDDLRRKLAKGKYRAVFMTHVETSMGVRNPIRDLVDECRKAGVYSIVDSVCGIGGVELDFDRLGADIVFTASQKALAAPPGAVLIAVSNEMLRHFERRKKPIESYYLNLLKWKPIMDDPKIYLATPAVQVLLALKQALVELKEEGLERRWKRHEKLSNMFRNSLEEMDIDIVAEEGYRSETVSAFWVREGVAPLIQRRLREKHSIEVSRGLLDNNQKMIRVGHFGILTVEQLQGVVDSLRLVLRELSLSTQEKQSIEIARHGSSKIK